MTEHTTAPAVLGDRVPQAVADYFLALDEGRFDDAVACFSEAARYAVPAPGLIETSPRLQTVGRGPLRDRFEARGARPSVHDILLCAVEGSTCILEGVSGTGSSAESSSFVASVELDAAGLIGRYLAYATAPAVVPAPGDVPTGAAAPGDAREVLDRYFTALDRGDFAAAADCFGADVLYSHPPYKHTGVDGDRRLEMHGRDALRKTFEARGAQSFDHRLLALIQRGPHCLVEGLVEGLPGGMSGSFLSSFTLDGDGLIARYLSFYCEPSVPVG